ncbi:unnamed protein product [Adineta ricciae]|uniref:RING-type domain-containing protein n=1 Tax=Adineta ricciae TaxID=249248 RepID=A0A813MTE6_ADIRI|nr:unnamed protein product [Adineta ricciae]CAF0866505.1 unnamed protein product [Adineta ricciae]
METDDDDNNEMDINEDFHLRLINYATYERKTFLDFLQYFIPRQTIIYIQYCLLRIPFLLAYDYLYTEQFASLLHRFLRYSSEVFDQESHSIFQSINYVIQSSLFQQLLDINLMFSIPILGLLLLIVSLLCSDRRLVIFYSYTTSLLVIRFYYQINRATDIELNMIILQFIFSVMYLQMLKLRPYVHSHRIQVWICQSAPLVYLFTRFFLSLPYGIYLQNLYCIVWLLAHLSELFIYQIESMLYLIQIRVLAGTFRFYNNFGIQTVLTYLQQRIDIITLMKIFWLTKILIIPLGFRTIYSNPFIINVTNSHNETIEDYNTTLTKSIYFTVLYYGTETTFTLMSFACLTSYGIKIASHRFYRLLHIWNEDVEQIGTIMGVMLFLLLFQSNLMRLDLHRRHIPLLKAFGLLIVASLHFLHTILEPQLLKVAMQTMTSRMAFDQTDEDNLEESINKNNRSTTSYFTPEIIRTLYHRHVYTCFSTLLFIILYTLFLWRISTLSTWILAITAFSLELIVRLLASLAQYILYVLEAHNRLANVDSFDEYIFRIKAVTSCFEFILGIFLLCNGFYILCYEARGALRAFMLAVHAHMNIIKNFRRGLKIFRNRKSAWHIVSQLPLATENEIQEYNDICSICHNSLTNGTTCVTPCHHLFHQKCLQKVFYANQNCALCSQPIVLEKNDR